MKVTNLKQMTKEWSDAKLGKIGGTRFKEIFKSDNLTLIDELIAEIGSNYKEPTFTTSKMQRGVDLEPIAKEIYSNAFLIEIIDMPLCISEFSDLLVLSPDGFTPDYTGAVEIKCPDTKTHVKYIRMDKIPSEYKYQILNYFVVNYRLEWLDFVSFDDRFAPFPLWRKRVTRSEMQTEIDSCISEFLKFETKFNKYLKQIIS